VNTPNAFRIYINNMYIYVLSKGAGTLFGSGPEPARRRPSRESGRRATGVIDRRKEET